MIVGAAFCPHPPLLVPSLAGTAAAEVAGLLAGCDAALGEVVAGAPRVLVLGSAAGTGEFPRTVPGSLRGYGGAAGGTALSAARPAALPLSLTIGSWLLRRARPGLEDVRLVAVADGGDADVESLAPVEEEAIVVMGDGSARRGPKAPGYLDTRAAPFDRHVHMSITGGDPGALAALDGELGAQLLAAGVPAWRAAGRLLGGRAWSARTFYYGDPFGVSYLAAAWTQ